MTDENNNIIFLNQEFVKRLKPGNNTSFYINKPLHLLFNHLENLSDGQQSIINLAEDAVFKKKIITNVIIRLKDNSILQHNGFPIYNEKEYAGHVVRFVDVTEREQKNNDLLHVKKLLQDTNEAAAIGAWEYDVTTNVFYWSDITKKIKGVEPDYKPNLENAFSFYKEGDSRNRIQKCVKDCLEAGTSFEEELELVKKSGECIWVKAIGKAVLENDRCIRMYGSLQDINNYKLLQLELEKRNQQFRSLFEHSPDLVFALDLNGKFADVNDEVLSYAKLSKEQILQLSFRDFASPQYLNASERAFEAVLKGEKPIYEIEAVNIIGEVYHLMVTNIPIIVNQKIIGAYGIAKDIIKEKKFEQSLKNSEERFHLAVEGSSDGIFDWSITDDKAFFSPRFRELMGYPAEEFIDGMTSLLEVLHPDDLKATEIALSNHLLNRVPYYHEYRLKTKSGEYKWFLVRGQALWNDDGVPYRMAGSLTDINEKKLLTEELTKTNERFNRLLEGTNDSIRESDFINPENSYVSNQLFELLGYNVNHLSSLEKISFYENLIHPDDIAPRKKALDDHIRKITPVYSAQFRLKAADGTYRWFFGKAKVKRDAEGNISTFTGSIVDIHQQKLVENSYKESQKRFQLAMEGSRDVIWDYDIVNQQFFVSHRLAEITGYPYEVLNRSFFESLIHPEDLVKRNEKLREHLDGLTEYYTVEMRVKHVSGDYRWFLSRAKASFNEKGEPLRITGSLTDIHHLKQLEHNQKALLSFQSAILKASPDKVVQINKNGIITYIHVPDSGSFLFQRNIPIIGEQIKQYLPADNLLERNALEAIEKNQTVFYEFELLKEHTLLNFEARIVPTEDQQAAIILRNITDLKSTQRKLGKNELKYISLIENMDLGLMEVDNNEIIKHVHSRFCEITGFSEQELIGKNATEILICKTEKDASKEIIERRKKGYSDIYEREIISKSGKKLTFLIS
ncbi:MAG: PAS domain-containing protein, partial [Chitinophagaceae bacterium]